MSDPKARSRKNTVDVAQIANVTPALIHNTYPDLAEKIRGLVGKATRTQRDVKHDALVRERETSRALRQELAELRADLAKLASVNQVLLNEVALLKGIATGKVVSILQPKSADV